MSMYLLCALLKDSKNDCTCTFSGYRVSSSDEVAIGSFVKSIKETKPGYSILDLSVAEVDKEDLRKALLD